MNVVNLYGPLQDLANAHRAYLYESFLFYYTAEVLEIVASLHHCGILHTDIKPDNFMLTDIRWAGEEPLIEMWCCMMTNSALPCVSC